MHPSFDRFGAEDVGQARGHRDVDTLAGAETRAGNFGAFHAGQSLRSVYELAHQRTVEDRQAQARTVRRFARDLEDCLGDLEGTDELDRDHFRRLAQLSLGRGLSTVAGYYETQVRRAMLTVGDTDVLNEMATGWRSSIRDAAPASTTS